jgi:hypothetical protein
MKLRFFIILGVLILAEYYSYIAVRTTLRNSPQNWRTPLLSLYIALTVMSWSGFFLLRTLSLPPTVRNLYVAISLGFAVGKVFVALLMFADDARRLFSWGIAAMGSASARSSVQNNAIPRSAFLRQAALLAGGLSVVGFTAGIANRYRYRVRKVKLAIDKLPPAFRGLKIVQISDIHTGSFDDPRAVEDGIDRILHQQADIILFTGDLVNNVADEVDDRFMKIYSKLKAPMGVYSTLGNHDYGDYVQWPSAVAKKENLERLKQKHADAGWRLLMNEHVVFERGQDKIALIGIENWSAKANFPKYGDMETAYSGLEEKQVPFKILLSHDPSHWRAEVLQKFKGVQLMLSGHTHGMQFGVDSKWLKWSPVQYLYDEWAGLYQEGDQYLYVNRGFGFLGYPGRLGVLPEITVIELV